jgi:hypothetical protein
MSAPGASASSNIALVLARARVRTPSSSIVLCIRSCAITSAHE